MHRVTGVVRTGDSFEVSLSDGRTVGAGAVILATGASYRRLGIASLEELKGAGVFYGGASSEAPGLTGKEVYVVGGGNAAGQAALHLARYAGRVTLVVRARSLGPGCRTTSSGQSRRRRTSRSGPAPRWWAEAARAAYRSWC